MTVVWIWLIAAGVLGAAEMLTGTFYMLILAGSALIGAGAGFCGMGLALQIGAAAVAAIAGCWWMHENRKKASAAGLQGEDSLDEGQTVEVERWASDGTASVRYRGTVWQAVPEKGAEKRPGLWKIVRVEGPRLLISPAK